MKYLNMCAIKSMKLLKINKEVAQLLHPDYYITTKRLIIGTNYYEIFNRDNVELISLKDNPIEKNSRKRGTTSKWYGRM